VKHRRTKLAILENLIERSCCQTRGKILRTENLNRRDLAPMSFWIIIGKVQPACRVKTFCFYRSVGIIRITLPLGCFAAFRFGGGGLGGADAGE
jgi:hypothetical protein